MLDKRAVEQVFSRANTLDLPRSRFGIDISTYNQYGLTQYDLEEVITEINENIDFFKQRLWNSGYTIENMIVYALDAKFGDPIIWSRNKHRRRYTSEYMGLLKDNS